MAYDPWDWTNSSKPMNAVVAPLAAMPIQTGNASMPNPVNTTGPLQQMVQQKMFNSGMDYAFKPSKPPTELAPVVDSVPAVPGTGPQVGGPMTGGGESMVATPLEPMAPLDVAEATGADIAGAEGGATAAAETGTLESLMSSIGALFAADGTTSVPNKAKGGK